jgi:hypothetical protein
MDKGCKGKQSGEHNKSTLGDAQRAGNHFEHMLHIGCGEHHEQAGQENQHIGQAEAWHGYSLS